MIKTGLPVLEDEKKSEPNMVGMCSLKDHYLLVTGGAQSTWAEGNVSTLTYLLDVKKG